MGALTAGPHHGVTQKVSLAGVDWEEFDVRIICMIGASGAGKNAILEALRQQNRRLEFIPSYTTRLPENDNEQQGRTEYIFIPREQFENMESAGKFIWTTPELAGARYGTLRRDLELAVGGSTPRLLHVQPDVFPALQSIVPPHALMSFFVSVHDESVLRHRLTHRGRSLSPEKLEQRVVQCRQYEQWARDNLACLSIVDNCHRCISDVVDEVVHYILHSRSSSV